MPHVKVPRRKLANTLKIVTILAVWYGGKQRQEKFHWTFNNSFHFLENSFSFKIMQKKFLWQMFTLSLIKLNLFSETAIRRCFSK